MNLPIVCPKCGSDKGWDAPRYHGTVNFVSPDELDAAPTVATLPTGEELVSRNALLHRASVVHQFLSWSCKVCDYAHHTPTQDQA